MLKLNLQEEDQNFQSESCSDYSANSRYQQRFMFEGDPVKPLAMTEIKCSKGFE